VHLPGPEVIGELGGKNLGPYLGIRRTSED
jgi:hypothetical protein